jgi:hypothetical protein
MARTQHLAIASLDADKLAAELAYRAQDVS